MNLALLQESLYIIPKLLIMRHFFHLRIKENKVEEYKERHRNVWPEMICALKEAGIRNYSIFLECSDVYGYWESENVDRTLEFLSRNEVNSKWQEYMSDVIITEKKERFEIREMEVFHME